MEGRGFLHQEINRDGGVRVNPKLEKDQKMPLVGSVMKRKSLSDVTNIVSSERPGRSARPGQENPKDVSCGSTKDYIAQLFEENAAVLKLIGDRNKAIELSNIELQKLQFTLQKANQQNWQLAQANSQMLVELNLGKERLKALQHELGCTVAVLRLKTSELDEKKKLNKQLFEKIRDEEEHSKCADVAIDASQSHSIINMACNLDRKCMLTNQTLGSITSSHQVSINKKDDRIRSSGRRSSNLKSEPCESKDLFEIYDGKIPVGSLITEPLHEDNPVQVDSSATSSSKASTKQGKNEKQKDRSASPQCHHNQELRRTSVGRPTRKAAEKVSSYKELPVNIKMRRSE